MNTDGAGGLLPRVSVSKEIFTLRDRRVRRRPGPSRFPPSGAERSLRDGLLAVESPEF